MPTDLQAEDLGIALDSLGAIYGEARAQSALGAIHTPRPAEPRPPVASETARCSRARIAIDERSRAAARGWAQEFGGVGWGGMEWGGGLRA